MYADDTTIYTIGNTIDEVAIALQVILDQLQTWCQKNRLIIHEGKCDAFLLDTKPFIGPLKPLVWGDKTIEYRQEKMRGQRRRLPVQPLGYVMSTKVIFRRAEVFVLAEVCIPRRPHAGQPRSDV